MADRHVSVAECRIMNFWWKCNTMSPFTDEREENVKTMTYQRRQLRQKSFVYIVLCLF